MSDEKKTVTLEEPIKIQDIKVEINQFIDNINKNKSEDNIPNTSGILFKCCLILLKIHCLFMDGYTLNRMFKDFTNHGIPQKQPLRSYNSIVYAGGYHIDNYIEYILTSNQGWEIIYQSNDVDEDDKKKIRCLNIKKMPQPIFSRFISSGINYHEINPIL